MFLKMILSGDLETLMYEEADSSHEPARAHESQEPSPPPKRLRGAQLSLDIAVSPINLTSLVLCISVNLTPELHTHCWSIIMCFPCPRFRAFSDLQDTDQRHAQVSDPPKIPAKTEKARNVLDVVAEYEAWSLANHPDFTPCHRMFMSVAKFICDMNAANYMMSNMQKLTIFVLIDGGNWRAHKRQLFPSPQWCMGHGGQART